MPLLTTAVTVAGLGAPLLLGVPDFSEGRTRSSGAVATYDRGRTAFITPGRPNAFDRFGAAVARGDFDRDGRVDLAFGAPGRDATPLPGAEGTVVVRYGTGEVAALGGPPALGAGAAYGSALAAGDLDRDGFDDLAVGAVRDAPVDPETDEAGSGTVHLVPGGPDGLAPERTRRLARPRAQDVGFGSVLTLGDVDRDGHLDLLEGAPGHPHATDGDERPGHLSHCPGTAEGPRACTALDLPREPGPDAIAVGDVTGDRHPDVVVGFAYDRLRREDAPTPTGAVRVFRGTAAGPAPRPLTLTQRTARVPGRADGPDGFGTAVAIAGRRLLVGAPGEDRSRGTVTVLRLRRGGRVRRGARRLDQGRRGMPGRRRPGDRFGAALAVVRARVAVGAPGDRGGLGSVTLLNGRRLRGGRVLTLRRTFDRDVPAPDRDRPYEGPRFGSVVR